MAYKAISGDCIIELDKIGTEIDLTFLDPPFNQGKEYSEHYDKMPKDVYWQWMEDVCSKIYDLTSDGGAIYFMQREKNTEQVLNCLRKSRWNIHNLIIWKKKTSAVPIKNRFGKQYQIIAYAIKGEKPRAFNRLRINPPIPANYKYEREGGIFLTDVWDDIRELTSGYFAGDEAIRTPDGSRFHKQQSPIQLLIRIILSSTKPKDRVLDPFAGSGTAIVVSEQLGRDSIGIDKDKKNIKCIEKRLKFIRESDNVHRFYNDYFYTENLDEIWGGEISPRKKTKTSKQLSILISGE
jgi:site-specific DNA-methyltransferase (adenine-specific)